MASASPTICLAAALSLVPSLAGAEPVLSGLYRTDLFGQLELSTQGDRLQGLMASGNACNFEGRRRVLEGTFEGNVLVGTLTLCQSGGPPCEPERAYPVLAVYSPADGSLATHVRLRPGCQSPVLLNGGRLVMTPVEDGSALRRASEGMASKGAQRRDRRSSAEAITELLKEGDALRRAGEFERAARRFEEALALDSRNALAHHLLGGARLLNGQAQEALESLEKARSLGLKSAETEYFIACAHGRLGNKTKGREHLRRAIRLGYRVDATLLARDADLRTLVANEAELRTFLMPRRVRGSSDTAHQDPPEP